MNAKKWASSSRNEEVAVKDSRTDLRKYIIILVS